jgi:hypothetical protein
VTPIFALGASTTGDSEIALGDIAWTSTLTAPTGFVVPTGMPELTIGNATVFNANVILGPATSSTTGTWSTTGKWGTYGIDVTP